MAVAAVMAVEMRLELREGRALLATLADLPLRHLRNTCGDRRVLHITHVRGEGTSKSQPPICRLTHHPAVVSAIIKEQLLVWVDLCGCTEEQFTIGRVRHQVLLLTSPKYSQQIKCY